MLTVTGNVFIPATSTIEKIQTKSGWILKFAAVSKHPRDDKRTPNKISLFIPSDKIEKATERIVPGAMLQIRFAELEAYQGSPDMPVIATVVTHWNKIELLNRLPEKERQ